MKALQKILLIGLMLAGKATDTPKKKKIEMTYDSINPPNKPRKAYQGGNVFTIKKRKRLLKYDIDGDAQEDNIDNYYTKKEEFGETSYQTPTKTQFGYNNDLQSDKDSPTETIYPESQYSNGSQENGSVQEQIENFSPSRSVVVNYSLVNYESVIEKDQDDKSDNMKKIEDSPEYKVMYHELVTEDMSEDEMNERIEEKKLYLDKMEVESVYSFLGYMVEPDPMIKEPSYLSPSKTNSNEEVKGKFWEARIHLLNFFESLKAHVQKKDGKLNKVEHFLVDQSNIMPYKFKIESMEDITRNIGWVESLTYLHYKAFYTEKQKNDYVNADFVKLPKDFIVLNPSAVLLLISIIGKEEVKNMQSYNKPGEYTMYLINPFPLNAQIKSLLFNTSKQPTVFIFQDLRIFTALEPKESKKPEKVNPYHESMIDTNITLYGRKLEVAFLTLIGQTEANLRKFINTLAKKHFTMITDGRSNIDKDTLKNIIKNTK